jgi:hypothetical protein
MKNYIKNFSNFTTLNEDANELPIEYNEEYFVKNPKGTITMKYSEEHDMEDAIFNINGVPYDIMKYIKNRDSVERFWNIWATSGGFGRGYQFGATGNFNYTYGNGEIELIATGDNKGSTCTQEEPCYLKPRNT